MISSNKAKGFTLVELLIVIVVIAILAAISIVAYNGIQQRSRDSSAASGAGQLSNKVEGWNGVKGKYPADTDVTGGLKDSEVKEAELSKELKDKIIITGTVDNEHPILYKQCDGGKGAKITYKQGDGTKEILRGNTTNC